jgi:hypothetical protein
VLRLSVAIQHHPSRPHLPRRLRRALRTRAPRPGGSGPLVEVVSDPDPSGEANPWRCARECWQTTPDWCTHRLVIQDDAVPCSRFLVHAQRALAARPDRITAFYVGTNAIFTYRRMLVAAQDCSAWVEGDPTSWVPCIALAMPAEWALSLGDFHDGTAPIADDDVVGRWCRTRGLPWYATIPSLVDHDDEAASLMRSEWANGRRVAACWVGQADPMLIDWQRG